MTSLSIRNCYYVDDTATYWVRIALRSELSDRGSREWIFHLNPHSDYFPSFKLQMDKLMSQFVLECSSEQGITTKPLENQQADVLAEEVIISLGKALETSFFPDEIAVQIFSYTYLYFVHHYRPMHCFRMAMENCQHGDLQPRSFRNRMAFLIRRFFLLTARARSVLSNSYRRQARSSKAKREKRLKDVWDRIASSYVLPQLAFPRLPREAKIMYSRSMLSQSPREDYELIMLILAIDRLLDEDLDLGVAKAVELTASRWSYKASSSSWLYPMLEQLILRAHEQGARSLHASPSLPSPQDNPRAQGSKDDLSLANQDGKCLDRVDQAVQSAKEDLAGRLHQVERGQVEALASWLYRRYRLPSIRGSLRAAMKRPLWGSSLGGFAVIVGVTLQQVSDFQSTILFRIVSSGFKSLLASVLIVIASYTLTFYAASEEIGIRVPVANLRRRRSCYVSFILLVASALIAAVVGILLYCIGAWVSGTAHIAMPSRAQIYSTISIWLILTSIIQLGSLLTQLVWEDKSFIEKISQYK